MPPFGVPFRRSLRSNKPQAGSRGWASAKEGQTAGTTAGKAAEAAEAAATLEMETEVEVWRDLGRLWGCWVWRTVPPTGEAPRQHQLQHPPLVQGSSGGVPAGIGGYLWQLPTTDSRKGLELLQGMVNAVVRMFHYWNMAFLRRCYCCYCFYCVCCSVARSCAHGLTATGRRNLSQFAFLLRQVSQDETEAAAAEAAAALAAAKDPITAQACVRSPS